MSKVNERIIWGDVESNGLDENKCKLLQVAFIVTDGDYNIISETFERKVFYSLEEVSKLYDDAIPYVQNMHTETGLWGDLTDFGVPLEQLDAELYSFLSGYVSEPLEARLGGNSITLDRNFLRKYLPISFSHISYRSYDMTSIDGFFRAHYGDLVPAKPTLPVGLAHNAQDDIIASINQAIMLRDFVKSLEK